jgi:hypothetical protein
MEPFFLKAFGGDALRKNAITLTGPIGMPALALGLVQTPNAAGSHLHVRAGKVRRMLRDFSS